MQQSNSKIEKLKAHSRKTKKITPAGKLKTDS